MASSANGISRLEATAAALLDHIHAIRCELWPRIRMLAREPGRAAATTAALASLVEPWLSDASVHPTMPLKIRKGNISVYIAHELDVLAADDMPRPEPCGGDGSMLRIRRSLEAFGASRKAIAAVAGCFAISAVSAACATESA